MREPARILSFLFVGTGLTAGSGCTSFQPLDEVATAMWLDVDWVTSTGDVQPQEVILLSNGEITCEDLQQSTPAARALYDEHVDPPPADASFRLCSNEPEALVEIAELTDPLIGPGRVLTGITLFDSGVEYEMPLEDGTYRPCTYCGGELGTWVRAKVFEENPYRLTAEALADESADASDCGPEYDDLVTDWRLRAGKLTVEVEGDTVSGSLTGAIFREDGTSTHPGSVEFTASRCALDQVPVRFVWF